MRFQRKFMYEPQHRALCYYPNFAFNLDADIPHRFGSALWAPVN